MGFGEIIATIELVDRIRGRVRFTTRGADDQDHPFTCALSEVWLECPSTARRAGQHGRLKITALGLAAKSDRDGATSIKDAGGIELKWPDRGAADDILTSLDIWPTDIIVEGYAHGDPAVRARISLLDQRLCGPEQQLRFDQASKITLSLTEAGLREFGLLLEDSLPELAWAVEAAGQEAAAPGQACPRGIRLSSNARAKRIIERWKERDRQGMLPDSTGEAVRALLQLTA